MLTILVRRLALGALTLLGVSMVIFFVVNEIPGDPIAGLVNPNTPKAQRLQFRHEYGFDQPLPVQYVRWLGRMLKGDLGTSIGRRVPVSTLLRPALKNSMILAGAAFVLTMTFGLIVGLISGLSQGRASDKALSGLAIIGMSLPPYWIGLMLIIIFGVWLPWLPTSGMHSAQSTSTLDLLRHLILPAIAAALIPAGIMTRMVRSSVIDVKQHDFVQALVAKGLTGPSVVRHIFRNAAPAILTVGGLQIGYLIGGSVLVETIFAWPGVGQMVYTAIGQRDMAVIQGGVLAVSAVFVLVNLLVDLVLPLFDPRIKAA
jgi:peptide/nickel transport system permease protein